MTENKPEVNDVLGRIDRLVRPVALYFGGFVVTALILLTVVQVGFRYLLNSPIRGADDLAQLLLVAVVAFSVAQSGRTGSQVAVEILGTIGGPKITRWTDILVKVLGVVMLIILTLKLIDNGNHAADFGEATLTLLISFGPFFYLLAFGMALYAVVLIVEIYVHLCGRPVVLQSQSIDDQQG
mgnify:FL=1